MHIGAIGDCINVASRLLTLAGPSEVVMSNAFHQSLSEPAQARCSEIEPVEAPMWSESDPGSSSRPGNRDRHRALRERHLAFSVSLRARSFIVVTHD